MPSVINTNVLSMTAQRNLSRAQSEMSTAVQRLSSGLRINSARLESLGPGGASALLPLLLRRTTLPNHIFMPLHLAGAGIRCFRTPRGAHKGHGNFALINGILAATTSVAPVAPCRRCSSARLLTAVSRLSAHTLPTGRHLHVIHVAPLVLRSPVLLSFLFLRTRDPPPPLHSLDTLA